LILSPEIKREIEFRSGHTARIKNNLCIQCGKCKTVCRFDAIKSYVLRSGNRDYKVDKNLCEGCGVCVSICPTIAIDLTERICGTWYVSDTRFGKMVHAKLGIAAENSGKLVSIVRREAKKIAEENNADFIIVDGPPGIGCSVIASVTGTDAVVIVTEPTFSGKHDLERVLELSIHFKIKSFVCINKWDINPEMTKIIESTAEERYAIVIGKIPYSIEVTKAQIEEKSIIEFSDNEVSKEIKQMWKKLCSEILK
jgi:MinD superfamily P-loop ATPase